MIIAGIVIGVALLVVLSGVLYVAANLAGNQPSNLWRLDESEDKLELKSNGKMKDSTGTLEIGTRWMEDYILDEDYYYSDYKYSIVDDILYLAPYNEDDVLFEDDCLYIKGLRGESTY